MGGQFVREKNNDRRIEHSSSGSFSKSDSVEKARSLQGLLSKQTFNPHPYLIGATVAVGVIGFYLGLLTLVSDWYNAKVQFAEYRWWVLSLSVGLGVQAVLYSFLCKQLKGRTLKTAKSSLAASGGLSAAPMAACCSHYLVTFLPVLGLPFLPTAAARLAEYQTQLFILGVLSNLFGIGVILRVMKRNGIIPDGAIASYVTFGLRKKNR
jgi:hypothetical protein